MPSRTLRMLFVGAGALALLAAAWLAAGGRCAAEEVEEKEKEKESDKPPRTIDAQCPGCRGTGLLKQTGCTHCQGDAYDGDIECTTCSCTGRVPYSCPYCDGTGTITWRGKEGKCRTCAGKGYPVCRICGGKGTIPMANPETVSYPTTPCKSCNGDGLDHHVKCRRCAGRGKITVKATNKQQSERNRRNPNRKDRDTKTVKCVVCNGTGKGLPVCSICSGRAYYGPKNSKGQVPPCKTCCGTGHTMAICRGCGRRGFIRDRRAKK